MLFVEYSLGYRILDRSASFTTGCLSEFKRQAHLDQEVVLGHGWSLGTGQTLLSQDRRPRVCKRP